MRGLEYFLSEEFDAKEDVSIEDVWELSTLIPKNKFTNQEFEEMFVMISDDGESWLNWNGKMKHIISNMNDLNFF